MQEYIDLEIDNFRNNLIRVSTAVLSLLPACHHACGIQWVVCGCLQTRMILNAGNLAMAIIFAVVSIWGINADDRHTDSYALFVAVSLYHALARAHLSCLLSLMLSKCTLQVTVTSCFGAIIFFAVLMGWCVWAKIVNNPFTACYEGRRLTG